MKMLPEHFEKLKTLTLDAIANHPILLTPEIAMGEYKRANLSITRFHFDMFYYATKGLHDFRSELNYLNDSHIQTAMRKILGDY